MKGHPATGKSAVAEILARRLGWPLIDKDDAKDHILGLPEDNRRAYDIMWAIAGTQLRLGLNVIAVSPLTYPAGYATARRLAERYGARLLVVETVLPEAIWRRRLDGRRPGDSTHKISGWEAMQAMLRQYDGCWQYPIAPDHHLIVDTSRPTSQSIQLILRRLELAGVPIGE
jgi:predicted kinase